MAYRKNGISVLSAVTISLMLLMILSAVAYLSKGFKDWNAKEWFKDKDVEEVIGEDESGNKLVSGNVYNLSRQITLLSSSFGDVTLSATVLPMEASNKEVDWAVEWVNPTSAWAISQVVTDYVTVEPTTDGATTAKLSCLGAFGEQVKIIVASKDNDSIKAECIVDFMKRLTGFSFKSQFTDRDGVVNSNLSFMNMGGANPYQTFKLNDGFGSFEVLEFTPTFGVGTKTENYELLGEVTLSSLIVSDLAALGEFTSANYSDSGLGLSLPCDLTLVSDMPSYPDMIVDSALRESIETYLSNCAKNYASIILTLIGEYSSFSKVVYAQMVKGVIPVSASQIVLDNSNIIF